MNTDRSIRPLVVQFVPLKVETVGDEWQQWARKYPPEGDGIPIIYVVRADGKLLYGKSGSLKGDAMPQFMMQQLQQAGKILSDQQLAALADAVSEAKKAMDGGDAYGAARRLAVLGKIGTPGELGCYAKPAVEADAMVSELTTKGEAALEAAKKKLEGDNPLEGAVALLETQRIYGNLPKLKTPTLSAVRDVSKNAELRELLSPAEAIDRAKAMVILPGGKEKAAAALQNVIAKYADSPAAKLAQETLQGLGSEEVAAAPSSTRRSTTQEEKEEEEPEKPSTRSSGRTRSAGTASTASSATARKKAASMLKLAKFYVASRPEKAKEYAEKVIELVPDTREAEEAQELLEQLK